MKSVRQINWIIYCEVLCLTFFIKKYD